MKKIILVIIILLSVLGIEIFIHTQTRRGESAQHAPSLCEALLNSDEWKSASIDEKLRLEYTKALEWIYLSDEERRQRWYENATAIERSRHAYGLVARGRKKYKDLYRAGGAGQCYSSQEFGFSIIFPENWTIKEPIQNENIVIKAIRPGDNAQKLASVIMSIFDVENMPQFKSYSAEDIFNLIPKSDDAILLDSGSETINGSFAKWVKVSTKINGVMPEYALIYIIVKDGIVYQLYGQTVLGGLPWFDENLPALLQSIRTFILVPDSINLG